MMDDARRDHHPEAHGEHTGARDAHEGTGHDALEMSADARSAHEVEATSVEASAGHGAPAAPGGPHAGHSPEPAVPERARGIIEHLEEMRVLQAVLEREREHEFAEQRRHDAEAQRLMDSDPKGHIEMMRTMQGRNALVRELPPALLRHEAALYQQIKSARQVDGGVKELDAGPLMAWHLASEHWTHIAVLPLGAWLIFSPVALAYRSAPLTWSDVVSGALVIVLAVLSMGRRPWAPWANAVVGLWVAFAPLVFWAPTPAAYANDTLVGALIVAFSAIIPMRAEMQGPDVPPGWTYSPSTWLQRAPVLVLSALSFFLARYMAAFQLGHIQAVWDPIFGKGTEMVLTSAVSQTFPVSDAGLGAYSYLLEFLSALMGDARRWRTMPWMVALFGMVVVPLGLVSTVLIMLQPVAVGAWCTTCLVTAVFMLIMVAVSLDEVIAMIQFLTTARRAGPSVWRLFWTGGTLPPLAEDIGLTRRAARPWIEMLWGTSFSWPLLASVLVGAWVMAAPWVFGTQGPAFTLDSVLGALVVVVAFVAWAEVTRAARFLNVLIAIAMLVATYLVRDVSLAARLNDLVAAALLIVLSVPRGPVRDRYGIWDPFIV